MILQVSGVTKAFGVEQVLRGASFRLDRREKVALVGRNGTGKTTLIRILTGEMEPDAGSVQLGRGVKLGYLRQEALVGTGRTVLEEAEEARRSVLDIQLRLQDLEERLHHEPTEDDLEEYAMLHEHFVEAQGYSADRDLKLVLRKMGFDESEFDKPASALSGGETTRLALARLLLEEPDVLVLDEPTNHLDLQATEWLENWIRSYPGAVLLVSHDRAFLANTAERVLDLADGQIKSYPGPFDKYLKLRAEEEGRQVEVARRQRMEIEKLDEYVRRFMNSQRTAQARGREKLLNRLIASSVVAPKKAKGMKGGFKPTHRSGDVVIECEGLSFGYDTPLFENLDWTVRIGERWGIVGENGSGKSTLVKTVLGLIEPWSGLGRLGANVSAGYFAQDTTDLDLDQSPLDYLVWECDMLPAPARDLLGRFLLTGDDVFRPIRTLSGGEKNKLSLARLTQLSPNLLVLDEPTNHLDMDSREALAGVLNDYRGTLVLVSHDRWLLEKVTDHTLDMRDGKSVAYPGPYGEYRRWVQRGARTSDLPRKTAAPEPSHEPKARLTPREVSKEIGRVDKLVAHIEESIATHEAELKDLEARLEHLGPHDDVLALTQQHAFLREVIDGEMAAWTEQSAALEGLRAQQGT